MVLVARQGNRRVVHAADRAALDAGLRVGMPATKAQALVPGLMIQDADLAGDLEGLERLAAWALRYTPVVSDDPPDGIVLDISGAAHLFGNETALLTDLVQRCLSSGLNARAAIADSWGAAHALARYSARPSFLSPEGEATAEIARLPLIALRLPGDMAGGLGRLGFEKIGDLMATPRAPLTLRFGPELGRRLDQATGLLAEPIEPIRTPDLVEVRRAFAEPIGAPETLAKYTGQLVVSLCRELELRGLGARRLDLLFHRVDNRLEAVRIGTARPVRDVSRLTRLLCDRIETVDPGFGVEIMSLTATLAEPFEQKQGTSLLDEPEADLGGLVDVLSNRVGEERVYRFAPVASDVPERSVARVAPASAVTSEGWPDHWPRPARLIASPERIDTVALLPDHPPASFIWRGIRHRVRRADGPERVFGEWWKREAELIAVRDYFQVENDAGERFWIFRAGDGENAATGSQQWFMHGLFA